MSSTAGFSDRISKQHWYAISTWSCYRNTFLIRNYSIIAVRLCLSHNIHSISVIDLSRQNQNMDSDMATKDPVLTNAKIFLWHETTAHAWKSGTPLFKCHADVSVESHHGSGAVFCF